eukprot:5714578-Prymnesium_polylepis.1
MRASRASHASRPRCSIGRTDGEDTDVGALVAAGVRYRAECGTDIGPLAFRTRARIICGLTVGAWFVVAAVSAERDSAAPSGDVSSPPLT